MALLKNIHIPRVRHLNYKGAGAEATEAYVAEPTILCGGVGVTTSSVSQSGGSGARVSIVAELFPVECVVDRVVTGRRPSVDLSYDRDDGACRLVAMELVLATDTKGR
jgi:hypothetical protein